MDNIFGAGGGGGGGGPEAWFNNIPACTRIWLGSTLVVTALVNLELIKWHALDFNRWEDVIGQGSNGRAEAWRMLTCFLFAGKFGFGTIVGLHLMVQVSSRYETMGPICTRRIHLNPPGPEERPTEELQNNSQRSYSSPYYARGETSDYSFALLFGMIGILITQILLIPKLPAFITHNLYHRFFHRHLKFYVLYIWSKQHPQHRVNFFGVSLSAAYLPYAYILMGYAMNNGQGIPVDMLHGMFVGHVYFYLACIVPRVLGGRRTVLSTPVALVDLCNWLEGRGTPVGLDGRRDDGPILADLDGVIGG